MAHCADLRPWFEQLRGWHGESWKQGKLEGAQLQEGMVGSVLAVLCLRHFWDTREKMSDKHWYLDPSREVVHLEMQVCNTSLLKRFVSWSPVLAATPPSSGSPTLSLLPGILSCCGLVPWAPTLVCPTIVLLTSTTLSPCSHCPWAATRWQDDIGYPVLLLTPVCPQTRVSFPLFFRSFVSTQPGCLSSSPHFYLSTFIVSKLSLNDTVSFNWNLHFFLPGNCRPPLHRSALVFVQFTPFAHNPWGYLSCLTQLFPSRSLRDTMV